MRAELPDCFTSGCFPHERHIRLDSEKPSDAQSQDGMIVDTKDADAFGVVVHATLESLPPNAVRASRDRGGAGIRSETNIGTKYLGSSCQFGEFVGIGLQFVEQREYAVSASLLHESNSGISGPNIGLTVVELRLSYEFR